MEELMQLTSEEIADRLKALSDELMHRERNDLLLRALGVSTLEKLRLEAAKGRLSRLLITKDYRFILPDYENKEVELQPVHKAVYLLFLAHPEGIEFKQLSDYREELLGYYLKMSQSIDKQKVEESIDRLVNPLDNAINEKCSRIKNVFLSLMDEYSASYYIVSSHVRQPIASSPRIWYRRLKNIALPRNLVVWESE